MQILAHNLVAQFTNRQLNISTDKKTKSSEKLSSGYKINRSADDAAGLQISEKMRSQIRGLNQASENIQDGISLCQVADGALDEVQNILQRMNELSVQAANDTNTLSDRQAIQGELNQLRTEINTIGNDTQFNKKKIFVGTNNLPNTGISTGLSYTQSKYIDCSKYDNFFSNITWQDYYTVNPSETIDTDALVQNMLDKGLVVNDGDKVKLYYSHDGASAGIFGQQVSLYALNTNTTQQIKLCETLLTNGNDPIFTIAQHGSSTEWNLFWDQGTGKNTSFGSIKAEFKQDIPESVWLDIVCNKDNMYMQFDFSSNSNNPSTTPIGDWWIQMGTNNKQGMFLEIGEVNASILGIDNINATNHSGAGNAIKSIQTAIEKVSAQRSNIGAQQNRLEHAKLIDDNTSENTQNAESRIRDTDMANEMVNFSKNNILEQFEQAMLAQANQSTQNILSLLN